MQPLLPKMEGRSGAQFSACGHYRYRLWRRWDVSCYSMIVIGLNPSTADETVNDPTIRRCIDFAKREGFGGLIMLNAYAFRSTDPKQLWQVEDPVGPENDAVLSAAGDFDGQSLPERVVAAWGVNCDSARAARVCELINSPIYCFGKTASGSPKHPLYLKKDTPLELFWTPPRYQAPPNVFARKLPT